MPLPPDGYSRYPQKYVLYDWGPPEAILFQVRAKKRRDSIDPFGPIDNASVYCLPLRILVIDRDCL